MKNFAVISLALSLLSCCRMPIDSSSISAAEAGQATIVLGACNGEFNLGWGNCLLERRSPLPFPTLQIVMTNAGEWAVGDCEAGLYRTGSVGEPSIVEVDLSGLKAQAEKNGFCLLKIEAHEKFKDSTGQTRSAYMRGGFFVEMIEPGYMPVPSQSDIAFCYKVERTTRGRTKLTKCRASR
jgi:hypothetical protein